MTWGEYGFKLGAVIASHARASMHWRRLCGCTSKVNPVLWGLHCGLLEFAETHVTEPWL